MRGEESVAKILEFAKSGKGGAKKIDHERLIMKSEKMKTRRKPIKPKQALKIVRALEKYHKRLTMKLRALQEHYTSITKDLQSNVQKMF